MASWRVGKLARWQVGELAYWRVGELALLPLADGEEADISLEPTRRWDVGAGPGQALSARVRGGVVGLVLDGRGRPIQIVDDNRLDQVSAWQEALNLYSE